MTYMRAKIAIFPFLFIAWAVTFGACTAEATFSDGSKVTLPGWWI